MAKMVAFVQRHPWTVILAFVLVTALAASSARHITMTTDIKEFFPENDPRVQTYDEISDEFGGGDYVMVAVHSGNVFDAELLTALDRLTERLETVPGALDVTSLANATEVRDSDWGIELAEVMAEVPRTAEEIAELRDVVMEDDFYRGTLVSEDEQSAAIMIRVDPDAESDAVVAAVEEITGEYEGPGELYITGVPVLNSVLVDSMQADLKKLIPLVLLIVGAVLFLYFRTLRGVLLPFATMLMSVVWTLGLMAWLGASLSPLSSVLPVILISLGNAYGIYILRRYGEESALTPDQSGKAMGRTMASVGVAVLLAGTTTVAGFSSNVTSEITMMKEFGLFTAFGVLIALVVSLFFIPAVLALLARDRSPSEPTSTGEHGGDDQALGGGTRNDAAFEEPSGPLGAMARGVIRRPAISLWGAAVVLVYSLSALPSLSTDSNFFNFFDAESPPRQAYDFVRDAFGGSETIEVLVEGEVLDPAVLAGMERVQEHFSRNERLSHPTSMVDILKRVDAALDPDKTEGTLPESRELAAQYLLLVEMDENNTLDQFTTIDYSRARIQARAGDTTNEGIEAIISDAEAALDRHLKPETERSEVTGIVVLMDALADMLVRGQVLSLLFSLFTVFVIVRLLLRSWEGSVLSVTGISLVTLALFAVMATAGIPLDIVTVLISSVAIGVGIDYSIHVYSRYQQERREGQAWEAAISRAITSTGNAIAANAGAVIAGFSILAISSFPPLRYFGILVSVTMFLAAAVALTFLPAAIAVRERRRERRQSPVGAGPEMTR